MLDTSADTMVATIWNGERHCHASGPGIPVSRQLEVTAFADGYHPTVFTITSYEPGVADFTIGLAEVTNFVVESIQQCSAAEDCLIDNRLRNQVIPLAGNSAVIDAFTSDPAIRDLALDKQKERYLAVSCERPNSLLVFPKTGEPARLTMDLTLNEPMVSPEGVTVDSDGNIYVVDWGGHQVVVLDGNGVEQFRFSELGFLKAGGKGHLVFPCRIAIEEDGKGIAAAGETIIREKHLLVTDRVGLHRFDSKGLYLDQPVSASGLGYPVGACSGVTIGGYGVDSHLSVIDRINGLVSRLRADR